MHTFTSKREQGKRFSNQTEQKKRKDEPITFTTITDEEFLVGLKTKKKRRREVRNQNGKAKRTPCRWKHKQANLNIHTNKRKKM